MAFGLIVIGLFLLIISYRGSEEETIELIKGDFAGDSNFAYWAMAIVGVGMLGYIPRLGALSKAFLGLIILVLFLRNDGFFTRFVAAVQSATATVAPKRPDAETINWGSFGGSSSSSGGSGFGLDSIFKSSVPDFSSIFKIGG